MGNSLKVSSFITGASQECILNSISELRGIIGTQGKSSASEKAFVIKKITNDIYSTSKDDENVSINSIYEKISKLIQLYTNSNKDFIIVLTRVLETYYGCKDGSSVEVSLIELSEDIFYYIT